MTDLPVTVAGGQEYGVAAEQRSAQEMVPMGTTPMPMPMPMQQRPPPGPLNAPTDRPNEPVQAGLASGPGAGPEALGAMDGGELTRATLQAMVRRFPSPTLKQMLMDMDSEL